MNNRDQVLDVLNHTIWKSALEVHAEINRQGDIALHTVHSCLHDFEDKGLVTSRLREITPLRWADRGGRGEREYKLTEEGLKKRMERKHEEVPDALPVAI